MMIEFCVLRHLSLALAQDSPAPDDVTVSETPRIEDPPRPILAVNAR